MNSIASRIVGILCMLGVVLAIGWLVVKPIKDRHDEQRIAEARQAYERQLALQRRQIEDKEEIDAEIAAISAEKLAREEEFETLNREKERITAEIDELGKGVEELIEEMNQRAAKNREAYVGRKFERFDPGNGKIYENVEVTSVTDDGIKLSNDLGMRTVRPEEVAENFQIRFRFGLVPGDKPLPVKAPPSED